ncbi:glycosyltransferase family 39 protein [Streptomyces sp. NPDC017529]|uniref:ArnT family glycosyltransferase n=1 Tax=Streptomyces sp. NPDC017529 TaxID=3365000 RepID=UPI00379A16F5
MSASSPPPPSSSAPASSATRGGTVSGAPARRRWQFWRSPADQPRWARPALLGIAAFAALLYAWNITTSGLAPYYSVAARSMTESWKAFLFTAYDPAATVTLDKIGGFLWPQAISARIFGFHDWSLTLPQCVEGVVSVLVMYRVVRRWRGAVAGLFAAGLLTLTPVAASMFAHAILDAALVMCLVLAADQYQRAVTTGRLSRLLFAGVWVGLGFQAKMMQAWLIAPALALGYLIAAPVTLRRRLVHLLTSGVVMGVVSLSWVLMVTFTPKDSRPYVDGSANNSAFSMVFGYNGFDRIDQGNGPGITSGGSGGRQTPGGSDQQRSTGGQGGSTAGSDRGASGQGDAGQRQDGGDSGKKGRTPPQGGQGKRLNMGPWGNVWHKLFDLRLLAQIGWLYPLALASLAFGLIRHRKRPRTDVGRGGYVMWGAWLLTVAVALSFASVPHTAYVATLAPALAALSAAGTLAMWRAYRTRDGRWAHALPVTIALQAAWSAYIAAQYPYFAPWLLPLISAAALVGLAALVLRGRVRLRHIGLAGAAAGCLAMFAAPAVWSLSVFNPRFAGTAFDANAGPRGPEDKGTGPPRGAAPVSRVVGGQSHSSADHTPKALTPLQKRILDYVRQHNGTAEYTFSADGGWARASAIAATGLPILPLGGLTGAAPSITLAEYRRMVASGELRYAMLTIPKPKDGGKQEDAPVSESEKISAWVRAHCTEVPPKAYGGPAATAAERTATGSLYRCSPTS